MPVTIDPYTGRVQVTVAGIPLIRRPPVRKQLTPEEEESLLHMLGRGSLGALSYVGETLAKPSRALWGSLSYLTGGEAGGGLLNLIPFSDTMGVTDPSRMVEASKFLETIGVMPKNKPGFDWFDPVRFGTDVLGDPMTWFGLGLVGKMLSPAGKIAQKAGLLELTKMAAPQLGKRAALEVLSLDDLLATARKMDEGLATDLGRKMLEAAEKSKQPLEKLRSMRLGGMYGINPPFGQIKYLLGGMKPFTEPSRSARVADALGELLWTGQGDLAARFAKWRAPGDIARQARIYRFVQSLSAPGRAMRMLFSPAVRGAGLGPLEQEAAEMSYWAMKHAEPIAYGTTLGARKRMDRAITATYREQERLLKKLYQSQGAGALATAGPKPLQGLDVPGEWMIGDVIVDPNTKTYGIITDADLAKKEITLEYVDPVYGTSFRNKIPASELPHFRKLHKAGTERANEFVKAFYAQRVGPIARHVAETRNLGEALQLSKLDLGKLAQQAGIQGWQPTQEMEKAFQSFGAYTVRENRKIHKRFLGMGGRSSMLDEIEAGIRHFPRQAQERRWEDRLTREGIRVLETRHRFAQSRRPELRTLPTAIIEYALGNERFRELKEVDDLARELVRDPYVAKYFNPAFGLREAMQDKFAKKLKLKGRRGTVKLKSYNPERLAKELAPYVGGEQIAKQAIDRYVSSGLGDIEHAKSFAEWIRKNPKRKYVLGEESFYGADPVRDELKYQVAAQRATKALQSVHELFAKYAVTPGFGGRSKELAPIRGAGLMPLRKAFSQLGMNPDKAEEFFGKQFPEIAGGGVDVQVPTDIVNAARAILAPNKLPETFQRILAMTDPFLRSWKLSVTTPWAAFHVRNHTSGQHLNVSLGLESLKDFPMYAKEYGRALRWANLARKGKFSEIPQELIDELETYNILGETGFQDIPLQRAAYEDLLPPGLFPVRQAHQEAAIDVATRPAPVLDILPGGQKMRRAFGTVTRTGGNMTRYVEWMNRVPLYTYLRKKGWSAAEAARRVKEIHFDYGDLSPFERVVMRRVMPFYTFSRKATELAVNELLTRPGGMLAQTIRAGRGGYQDSPYLPEYVAQTTAVPLPTEGTLANVLGAPPEGTKRYLTSFGLAHEDPISLLVAGEWGSRLHPLLKFAIERQTGHSLFHRGPSGARALEDVDPTIGRIITNIQEQLTGEPRRPRPFVSQTFEQALANSPLSRLLTTLRTATDPRKIDWTLQDPERRGGALLINLLTGLRVTDVSPAAQQEALRRNLNRLIRHLPGGRQIESVWIPEDIKGILSPEELQTYEAASKLRSILEREARKAARRTKLERKRRRRRLQWWEENGKE